jgi:hypothetical protein
MKFDSGLHLQMQKQLSGTEQAQISTKDHSPFSPMPTFADTPNP